MPFMGVIYVGTALIIILMNYDRIGWAFGQIFEGAFTGLGVAGGMVGALIQGFRRAAFSNEAGVGSAAIAHSAVRTKEPITEGFVSLLEPFIDTVVICTMTALVIIITGQLAVDPDTGNHVLYTLSSVKDLAGTLPDLTAEQLAAINAAETGDAMNTALEAIPAGATADALNAFNGMVGQIISEGDARGVGLTSAAFSSAFGWFRDVSRGRRRAVRLFDHDLLELLWREGVDLSVRRRQDARSHLQGDFLHLRLYRRRGQP